MLFEQKSLRKSDGEMGDEKKDDEKKLWQVWGLRPDA